MSNPRRIVLIHKRAPGDTCVLTGLVRDIALAHPGKFEIDVDTSAMDLWLNNPHITPLRQLRGQGVEYVKINYGRGLRDQNHEPVHFLPYFHRDFERQCKVKVPLLLPYPDLHLSAEEQQPLVTGRYWVILSGGKSDFTAKVWDYGRMQQVADELRKMGLGVVQIGGKDGGHTHPTINGALDLVGQTDLRDMIRLIKHAEGVICIVTCAMHMAAALQKPCVVIGGGREAWWWEAYVRGNLGLSPVQDKLLVPHQYLHTIGLLDCCQVHGCWKNKVVKINDDESLCKRPVIRPGQPIPLCMDLIKVHHVMRAVMQFYEDKTLPPIEVDAADVPTITMPTRASQQPTPAKSISVGKSKPGGTTHNTQLKIPKDVMSKIVQGAKLRGQANAAKGKAPQSPAAANLPDSIYDNEDVGGRYTICVLLYGPEQFFPMHKRCLDAIIGSVPLERFDLRVGSNALNAKSLAYVQTLVGQGIISKHYYHPENAYKYPVMREMFFDPELPIKTKWVVWFDDDSIADRTNLWLKILSQAITIHHRRDRAHLFGSPFLHTPEPGMRAALAQRPWHHGKPLRLHNGTPSPSGNKIIFCSGGFWAITHEAIVACDIPDLGSGLTHNGGDIQIGEQLYQGGFGMKAFNGQKQFVHNSSVPRRGVTMPFPGSGPKPVPRLSRVK